MTYLRLRLPFDGPAGTSYDLLSDVCRSFGKGSARHTVFLTSPAEFSGRSVYLMLSRDCVIIVSITITGLLPAARR